jgi:uncharacterized membrane protein YphA (DoxX/SURF4 family)
MYPTPSSRFTRFAVPAARVLLGLIFFVFGLNGFLNFFPPPPPEQMPKAMLDFFELFTKSGYLLSLVKGTEVAMGALLLLNRFVPLALVVLAPVIVNIVLVHILLAPSGLAIALVILGLELYLAWAYRQAFASLLTARFD